MNRVLRSKEMCATGAQYSSNHLPPSQISQDPSCSPPKTICWTGSAKVKTAIDDTVFRQQPRNLCIKTHMFAASKSKVYSVFTDNWNWKQRQQKSQRRDSSANSRKRWEIIKHKATTVYTPSLPPSLTSSSGLQGLHRGASVNILVPSVHCWQSHSPPSNTEPSLPFSL